MKILFALLGAPGVGKSTSIKEWSKDLFPNKPDTLDWFTISPDNLRSMASSPIQKPDGSWGISGANESFIWGFLREALDKRINRGEMVIVDATHSRESAISVYKKYSEQGYRIVLVDFSDNATLEEILERNRKRDPIKFVPEHAIETIFERIQTINIPTWVQVIKPNEFVGFFRDIKFNFSEKESISFIGDIHGCNTEFKALLGQLGVDPNEKNTDDMLVFVGDYFDRGMDPIGVFKLLQKLSFTHECLFLMGNHEEPLAFYTEFFKDINQDIQIWINDHIKPIRYELPNLSLWETLKIHIGIMEEPDLVAIAPSEEQRFLRKYINLSYKRLDGFIEILKQYPELFEEFAAFVRGWKPPRELIVDPDTKFHKLKRTSLSTVKQFLLSDIRYTEVSKFQKRLAQMFYADYHDVTLLATHGGIVDKPSRLTPTADMIRGVGDYEDSLLCDETFHKKNPNIISIHGHRNVTGIPIESTPGTYNINGDVDIGLRAVKIALDKDWKITKEVQEVKPFVETKLWYRAKQIERAKSLKAKKLSVTEENNAQGMVKMFQDHKHIDVKKLPKDIASVNFTRKAFQNGIWDNYTVKARGLFIDISRGVKDDDSIIIARGYEKFFNLGERFGIEKRDLYKLVFPLKVFEKANGYLGILSVDTRGQEEPTWFFASKTTTESDFAQHFKKLIFPLLNDNLKEKMIKDNVTLLFEVIDPSFDTHIEEYKKPAIILLDAVKNQFQFDRQPYEELANYLKLCNSSTADLEIRQKRLITTCETLSDFHRLLNETNDGKFLINEGIEGFVVEDSFETPDIFKIKTEWYSFWKKVRATRDRVTKRLKNKFEKNPKERATLDKSELNALKKYLHTAEDIKVFNKLVEIAEEDFIRCDKISIPELRHKILDRL